MSNTNPSSAADAGPAGPGAPRHAADATDAGPAAPGTPGADPPTTPWLERSHHMETPSANPARMASGQSAKCPKGRRMSPTLLSQFVWSLSSDSRPNFPGKTRPIGGPRPAAAPPRPLTSRPPIRPRHAGAAWRWPVGVFAVEAGWEEGAPCPVHGPAGSLG